MPGTYTARLTVNGKVYEQPLILKMDPRLRTPVEKLQQQPDLMLIFNKKSRFVSYKAFFMRGLNKVTLIGNLGDDPDVQVLAGDITVAKFSLATTERYTDKKRSSAFRNRMAYHSTLEKLG
jgi:hypothetical protein